MNFAAHVDGNIYSWETHEADFGDWVRGKAKEDGTIRGVSKHLIGGSREEAIALYVKAVNETIKELQQKAKDTMDSANEVSDRLIEFLQKHT